jgi:hypothetical protein
MPIEGRAMISNDIEVAEKIDERRDAPRTGIAGRYTMQLDPCDGRDVVSCAVLDYSVTGARLELPQDMALPINLQVVIGTLAHNARVVWRNGVVIGVDFVDEHYSIY